MPQAKYITNSGWVKVHRSLERHWIAGDAWRAGVWIYFLLRANYKDTKILFNGQLIEIPRGSFISSELKLSKQFKCSRTKIHDLIVHLIQDQMLCIKRAGKGTQYTIVNYAKYQDISTDSTSEGAQQGAHECTTEKQKTVQQKSIDKEIKNIRKKEYIYYPTPESPARFTQQQIDYFLKTWGKAEFHHWVGKLIGWAEESPAKFAKKKDHGRCIRNWRERELGRGLLWYDHPQQGAAYYRTYDVERWQNEDRKIN
jgi:hypothetical protein